MPEPLYVLLADDDADDRYFFDKALKAISVSSRLTTVVDGEQLMAYLLKNFTQLPDVLFLDLNMPRKNGSECLCEIKSNKALKDLPVIIYSTSLYSEMADLLHTNGAHYYIKKSGLAELESTLQTVLELIRGANFVRPTRDEFILKIVAQ
ncbi:MAG: response regulator [Bacteroidota bacterium]